MRNNSVRKTEEPDFKDWLRQTAEKLKRGELPPEAWDERHSPLEESAVQRRIAALISRIAAKEDRRRH
ncbi:MAG TPA: hypothetical protein VFY21_12700 [Xanthobacteraceae bacterium]|nr:hypothetical protein [Xanthobacteraceae bacterium]